MLRALLATAILCLPVSHAAHAATEPPRVSTVGIVEPRQDPVFAPQMLADYRQYCTDDTPSVSLRQFGGDRATFIPQRNNPDVLAECLDGYRILPDALTPALNTWHVASDHQ